MHPHNITNQKKHIEGQHLDAAKPWWFRRTHFSTYKTTSIVLCLVTVCLMADSVLALSWVGEDLHGRPCTGRDQGFGPYDYTDPATRMRDPRHNLAPLKLVEKHHFTGKVEQLIKGEAGYIISDIDYTLRAFPNHHRALYSIIRLYTEPGHKNKPKEKTPPECYLQRAEIFSPKDPTVQILFGIYLHKVGKNKDALKHYHKVLELNPNSAEGHYNLGLLLLKMKRYDEARTHAQEAYKLGYPLQGLRQKLTKLGHWP